MTNQPRQKLYRYYDVQYSAGCDEFDNDLGPGRVGVHLMEFEILRETHCGVWILDGYWFGDPNEKPPRSCQKFVNMNANKKYACRTKEEAKESFMARKRRQIQILSMQIKRAEKALTEALEQDIWPTNHDDPADPAHTMHDKPTYSRPLLIWQTHAAGFLN